MTAKTTKKPRGAALRSAAALERAAEALDRMASSIAPPEPEKLTQAKLDKTITENKHTCPFCASQPVTLFMRGGKVFGCSHCIPPFVGAAFSERLARESWISGVKWAEAIVRLARDDADRDEIADAFKKEIDKKEAALLTGLSVSIPTCPPTRPSTGGPLRREG